MRRHTYYLKLNKSSENAENTEELTKENNLDKSPLTIRCCCLSKEYESLESINEKIENSEEHIEMLKKELETHREQSLFCGT